MQHVFLAFTNPTVGREAAFNEWYDSRHVPEVLRYGRGFMGCRRFKLHDVPQAGPIAPWRYIAMYTLQWEDLAALAERPWILDSPPLTPFRGLLDDDHVGWVFSPCRRDDEGSAAGPLQCAQLDELLLVWSSSRLSDQAVGCAMAESSGGGVACGYELAGPQRRGQQDSPWRGLMIYALARGGALPPLKGFSGAWRFRPVSPYIVRSDL